MKSECCEHDGIQLYELVYIMYFILMFGAKAIGLYEGMIFYNVSIVIAMFLFGLKLVMTRHTLLEYAVITVLLGLGLGVYLCSGEKGLLFFITMMLGMKGVNLLRVEKIGASILGISFTVLTFLSVFYLIDGKFTISANRLFFHGVIWRHYLGYPNCNVTHTTFIVLLALIFIIYLSKNDEKWREVLFLLYLINLYVYFYDVSETGLVVSTLLFVLLTVMHGHNKINVLLGIIAQSIFPFFMLCITLFPAILPENIITYADTFLHGRILFLNRRLTQESFTMFGQRIGFTSEMLEMLESNSYAYLLVQLGIVPCIAITVIMTLTAHYLVKDNRLTEVAIFISFCVLGLSDAFMFNLSYKNILFLFSGEYLYKLLERIVVKMHPIWGKEMQIIEFGSKEVTYGDFGIIYFLREVIRNLIISMSSWAELKRVVYLGCMVAIVAIISYKTMNFTDIDLKVKLFAIELLAQRSQDSAPLEEAFDSIRSWEYLRRAVSVGVWSSGILALSISSLKMNIQIKK